MIKCKCADCKIEFEYDYKISICDDCLKKYKTGELPIKREQNENGKFR